MHDLQVWLPAFDPALSSDNTRRDVERAMHTRVSETRIWLVPWADKQHCWRVKGHLFQAEQALPSEDGNWIDIYTVGRNGFVCGFARERRLEVGPIGSLLSDWLSVGGEDPTRRVAFVAKPPKLDVVLPVEFDKTVRFGWYTAEEFQYGSLEVEPPDEKQAKEGKVGLNLRWPRDAPKRLVVAPNMESVAYSGKWELEEILVGEVTIPTLVSEKLPGVRSLATQDVWPGSLRNLIPFGSGLDVIYANQRMQEIAERSLEDPDGALVDARQEAAKFVIDGHTSRWTSWFVPMCIQYGADEVVMALETQFDLEYSTIWEAFESKALEKKMGEQVRVRHALGVLGLFWALLLDELEAGRPFHRCERCGRMIQGRSDKRYCNKQDSLECWRERRSKSRRNERAKSKKKRGRGKRRGRGRRSSVA